MSTTSETATARPAVGHQTHHDKFVIERTLNASPAGAGTRMRVTDQGVFLDDYDGAGSRERGTRALMDALETSLRA